VRTIGIMRARAKIGLQNLVYNNEPCMSDFRHKLRNARLIVATSRETKNFAVKYA
jgi:hypothetical protein